MKLKVGDYVRIVDNLGKQFIGEIYNINDFREPSMKYAVDCQIFNDYAFVGEERILKSSPNIIDLIQVGDYVNGKEIEQIINNELYFETNDMASIISFKEKDIKSIVTKEQFKSMEYRIGDLKNERH